MSLSWLSLSPANCIKCECVSELLHAVITFHLPKLKPGVLSNPIYSPASLHFSLASPSMLLSSWLFHPPPPSSLSLSLFPSLLQQSADGPAGWVVQPLPPEPGTAHPGAAVARGPHFGVQAQRAAGLPKRGLCLHQGESVGGESSAQTSAQSARGEYQHQVIEISSVCFFLDYLQNTDLDPWRICCFLSAVKVKWIMSPHDRKEY